MAAPVPWVNCLAVLGALGEMNRLWIMRQLIKKRLGVGAISARLRISRYNVSRP
jgi:hypothetical protein